MVKEGRTNECIQCPLRTRQKLEVRVMGIDEMAFTVVSCDRCTLPAIFRDEALEKGEDLLRELKTKMRG